MKKRFANPANRPTLALGAACLFLFVVLMVQVLATPQSIDLPPVSAADAGDLPEPAVVAAVDMPSLAEFETIVGRPLFSEDRRPQEDEDAAAGDEELVEANIEPPPVTLAGVVLTGDHQIAMLLARGEPMRLEVGMDVEGWVLETLEPRRAILSNGEDSLELELPLYVAPPQQLPGRRGGGLPPGQAKKGGGDDAEGDQALSVRERIQKAREERERMRQYMKEQAGGDERSRAAKKPGNK